MSRQPTLRRPPTRYWGFLLKMYSLTVQQWPQELFPETSNRLRIPRFQRSPVCCRTIDVGGCSVAPSLVVYRMFVLTVFDRIRAMVRHVAVFSVVQYLRSSTFRQNVAIVMGWHYVLRGIFSNDCVELILRVFNLVGGDEIPRVTIFLRILCVLKRCVFSSPGGEPLRAILL